MNPESIKSEISKNITFHRKQRGLTQREAAALYGVKANTLCNWEKGNTSIEIDVMLRICSVLKIHLSDILGTYFSFDPHFSPEENLLIHHYRELNEEGQEKLLDYADDLVVSGKYKKNHSSVLGEETA